MMHRIPFEARSLPDAFPHVAVVLDVFMPVLSAHNQLIVGMDCDLAIVHIQKTPQPVMGVLLEGVKDALDLGP